MLHLWRAEYANTIDEIVLFKDRKIELTAEATPNELSGNRSILGTLGRLSSQIRLDLAAGVAMGQRRQTKPTVQDMLETNRLIKLVRKHAGEGLEFTALRGQPCLVTCHDASWANADEPPEGVASQPPSKLVSTGTETRPRSARRRAT